jgi:RNA-directed DNA polymerase
MATNWDEYRRDFEALARQRGLLAERIERHLRYALALFEQGLPIIHDRRHLADLIGFELSALTEHLALRANLYRSYLVVKRNGGLRAIDEPLEPLASIQRWILRRVLNKVHVHAAVSGFVGGRSILTNARPHVGQPQVLSLDIHDFFGSVKPFRVRHAFRRLGYVHDVAEMLTDLCVLRQGLPQGAPTSPALSNLVFRPADVALSRLADEMGVRYSRYADDLTFSGVLRPGRLIYHCEQILARHGLELNRDKVRTMLRHQRQEVTGIVVNERPQAPRSVRRRLRQEAHYIRKFGLEDHLSRTFTLLPMPSYANHLRGLAEFVRSINPDDRDARVTIETLGRIKFSKPPTGEPTG